MNILIIPAFFQTKQRPASGSFFMEQAKALAKKGHNVSMLYCDTYSVKCIGEWIKYEESAQVSQNGVSIYRKKTFCPLKHGIEGHSEAFAKGITELFEQYLSDKSFDVIHAHCCVWAGYAAMKLSDKINVPYVITEHATLFQLHRDKISSRNNEKIKQAFRRADRVICVSRAFATLLSEYRENIDVIGNVVDCESFRPPAKAGGNTKGGIRFLTICFMEKEAQLYKKGIDVLLKAWKGFVKDYPSSKLVIGGGGHAIKKAVEWVRELGLEDSIEFTGALTREQVVLQMQECDCFVLPSRYETFGVVYIEAMACGKPVIAAQNGGPDDFVKDFNGVLIRPEDVDELIEALRHVSENRENYKADEIHSYVKRKFSSQAIARQLEEIYSDTCKAE